MIELIFEYLFVLCIWLFLLIMSRTRFRVNPQSVFAKISRHSFAHNRCDIWILSGCNETRTHNRFVRERTLHHLAKLTKWLSWVVSTYLYAAFNCIFFTYSVRFSERIYTLCLPECQGTPCSKQARYLKFK